MLLNNQPELVTKHQANIAASLAHRLDRARATRNFQLLTLLEQEQQLIQSQPPQTVKPIQWGKAVLARLMNAMPADLACPFGLANSSTVSLEAITSDSGSVIWRAYDPTTGETRYAETEAEVIDWLEAQRSGSGTSEMPYSRAARFGHFR